MTHSHDKPVVAIVPALGTWDEQVERLFVLTGADNLVQRGDPVLVKPNLHAPMHYATGSTVNPAMIAAVVRWCRRRGASRVIVGDGPFYGSPQPRDIFTKTGVAQAVEAAGAEWVVFDEHEFRLYSLDEKDVPSQIGVTRFVTDCAKLINLALLKTHLDTMVTLGLKNLKGCIRPRDKAAFHKADIERSLVALNRIVKAHFTIIDGTIAMEGMGPATGRPVNFGFLFAGRDVLATDTVAAAAMGFGPNEIRLHRLAHEAQIGCGQLENITVVGEPLHAIRRRFERPYEQAARSFGHLKILSEHACSGCKIMVYRALSECIYILRNQRGIPLRTILLGRGCSDDPEAIFIGQCASSSAGSRRHLNGCPPTLEAMKAFLLKCAQGT